MAFFEVYSIIVPTVTLAALLYAGIEDLLFREVRRDLIWLIMAGVGLILDILYLVFFKDGYKDILADMLLNILLALIIGFVLFYVGAWGGADSKALWALSVLTPIHPFYDIRPLSTLPTNFILIIDSSTISILLNSGLLAIFYPLLLLIINAISSTRGSLFDEVRAKSSEKARCFFFGYRKKVSKINPKKLHYDFLEELPPTEFRGRFTGDFKGRLDGKFTGSFEGKLDGSFSGKIIGRLVMASTDPVFELDPNEMIAKAEEITKKLIIEKDETEEEIDYVQKNYQKMFFDEEQLSEIGSEEKFINYTGTYSGVLSGIFIGTIEGVFDGELNLDAHGLLEGYYFGSSGKGKVSGKKKDDSKDWRIKIRAGLDEENLMEKRQLRTLWLLETQKKETVWVTPGIPFVFLMLIGYILYLFFGNFALYLFRLA